MATFVECTLGKGGTLHVNFDNVLKLVPISNGGTAITFVNGDALYVLDSQEGLVGKLRDR
jgi:hypothetical protein